MKEHFISHPEDINPFLSCCCVIFAFLVLFFILLPREKYTKNGRCRKRLKKTARFDVFLFTVCFLTAITAFVGGLDVGVKCHDLIPSECPVPLVCLMYMSFFIPFVIIVIWLSYSPLGGFVCSALSKKFMRSDFCDDTENPVVPDVPDCDTGVGGSDNALHHD